MPHTAAEATRVHSRRAVGFLLMSALLPGSVQRFAGNKQVGRVATHIWLGLITLVVLIGLGALLLPGPTVGALLTPWVMTLAKIVIWTVFIGWVVLLFDSWRLARPMELPQRTRLAMTLITGTLAILVGVTTGYIASAFTAAANVGHVLPGGGDTRAKDGRYNVLLLGADAGDGRIGLRPDSINVASVDEETGRTVLFGLPRNMQGVPFSEDSPMHELYPDGFECPDNECMLNAVWTTAEDHADLFPEDAEPGLEATKDAVATTLGIELNYYALVDMHGFESIVDAMDGIEMDIMKPIPIGGGSSPIKGYIEPGTDVHLDGYHALWFARSREGSSDYERMQRQKCVLAAMANQLDPQLVATKFVDLSEAGKDLLSTDIPTGQLVDLAQLALKARNQEIASVNFTPPLVPDTSDPDFDMIRKHVKATLAKAETADEEAVKAAPASPPSESSTPAEPAPAASADDADPTDEPKEAGDPNAYKADEGTDDLAVVCRAG